MTIKNKEFIKEIVRFLKSDSKIRVSGLGIFKLKQTKEREGRNPKTGEPVKIPARIKVAFRPAKELKDQFNS